MRRFIAMAMGVAVLIGSAAAIGQPIKHSWRCSAEREVIKGERGCSAVFVAETRSTAIRFAHQLCEETCGGSCRPIGCEPAVKLRRCR